MSKLTIRVGPKKQRRKTPATHDSGKPKIKRPKKDYSKHRDKGGLFAKGNPGGPTGPKPRQFKKLSTILKEVLCEDAKVRGGSGTRSKKIMDALVKHAEQGKLGHIVEILDRTEGKVATRIDLTNDSPMAEMSNAELQEIITKGKGANFDDNGGGDSKGSGPAEGGEETSPADEATEIQVE